RTRRRTSPKRNAATRKAARKSSFCAPGGRKLFRPSRTKSVPSRTARNKRWSKSSAGVPTTHVPPHPARATQRRLAPSGETAEFLRSPVDPTNAVSDPPPSLHGHYPASSLLWGGPRLTGPSVLSASRVNRLSLFPWHGQPGSQVPYESLGESHAS